MQTYQDIVKFIKEFHYNEKMMKLFFSGMYVEVPENEFGGLVNNLITGKELLPWQIASVKSIYRIITGEQWKPRDKFRLPRYDEIFAMGQKWLK